MLAHEDEHVRARDPLLLAARGGRRLCWRPEPGGVVAGAAAASGSRNGLRCSRTLRNADAPAVRELLLRVGQRRARLPLGAPALGEPASSRLQHPPSASVGNAVVMRRSRRGGTMPARRVRARRAAVGRGADRHAATAHRTPGASGVPVEGVREHRNHFDCQTQPPHLPPHTGFRGASTSAAPRSAGREQPGVPRPHVLVLMRPAFRCPLLLGETERPLGKDDLRLPQPGHGRTHVVRHEDGPTVHGRAGASRAATPPTGARRRRARAAALRRTASTPT